MLSPDRMARVRPHLQSELCFAFASAPRESCSVLLARMHDGWLGRLFVQASTLCSICCFVGMALDKAQLARCACRTRSGGQWCPGCVMSRQQLVSQLLLAPVFLSAVF